MEYQHFLNIFIDILNKHAHIKQTYLRANQGRFMSKDLRNAIMKRSRRSRIILRCVIGQIFPKKNIKSK